MRFKLTKISDKIYHLHFNRQVDLTTTFIRFSEYCESPRFRGTIFSLKEYKEWYTTVSKKKKFTYFQDVSGFNIPSRGLKPFVSGKFNPLTRKEKIIVNLFKDIRGKFCIIGTYAEKGQNMQDTLQHEIAHGLFYTDRVYREKIKNLLKKYDLTEINEVLKKEQYPSVVWIDEAHAYIMCDLRFLRTKMKLTRELKELSKKLNLIFKKYYKEQ